MTDTLLEKSTDLIGLTAGIVSAYVRNHRVSPLDLCQIIADTHAAMKTLQAGSAPAIEQTLVPAVPIKKSITPEFLICLEDGKKFRSLKRHLAAYYDLTPDAYRQKWKLSADYPMVAPGYSAKRSALAKRTGLGRKLAGAGDLSPKASKRKKLGLKLS